MNVMGLTELVICLVLTVGSVRIQVLYPETLRNRYPAGITAQTGDGWLRPYGSYLSGELQVQEDDCSKFMQGADFVLMRNNECALLLKYITQEYPKVILGSQEHFKEGKYPVLFIDPSIVDAIKSVYGLILLNITFDMNPTLRPTWELQITSNREAQSLLEVLTLFNYEEVNVIASIDSHTTEDQPDEECVLNSPAGKHYQKAAVLYCLMQETWIKKSHIPDVDSIVQQICSRESDLSDFGFDVEALDTCVDELMIKDSSIVTSPTLVINGQPYDGSVDQVKRALCASFSSPGEVCSEFFCTPGCWIDLLSNGVCDAKCNNPLCDFDRGDCASDLRSIQETHSPDSTDLDSEHTVRRLQSNSTIQEMCTYQDPYTGQKYTQSCDQISTPAWALAIIVVLAVCCCPALYALFRLCCIFILHILSKALKQRRPDRIPSGQRVTLNRI